MLKPPRPSYLELVSQLQSLDQRRTWLSKQPGNSDLVPGSQVAFIGQRQAQNQGNYNNNNRGASGPRFASNGRGFPAQNRNADTQQHLIKFERMTQAERDMYRGETCNYCGVQGHVSKVCWWLKKKKAEEGQLPKALAALTLDNSLIESDWTLDTGASNHMVSKSGMLTNLKNYHGTDSVMIGDGSPLPILGIGDLSPNTEIDHLSMNNILLVPALKKNLLSVSQLTKNNPVNCIFNDAGFCIKEKVTGQTLQEGKLKGNLYTLASEHSALFATSHSPSPSDLWHQRLGHSQLQAVHTLKLPEFPGGSETFEIAAKFCYGVKIDLSPANVAALRCAGDYLQMTEDHFEDNLNSVTELFFSQYVLRNIKHSIQTLHSCQRFLLLAENLGIVQRCIDSIADKSSSIDPSLFGWPVSESAAALSRTNTPRRLENVSAIAGPKFWFKELAILDLNTFKRLIIAMKVRYTKPEIIESCLIAYARKHNLLNSRVNLNKSSSSSSSSNPSEIDQRELLETIIAYLPMQKSSNSPTSTKFLCGLLRTAYIINASEICRSMLEKKIGSQLEQATLDDLLIPSYSYLTETLYDVDFVDRVLEYFLEGLDGGENDEGGDDSGGGGGRLPDLMSVGKLMDDFLSEIASDASLTPERFYQLSVSLPEHARLFDDGLYRAIDIFLKVHPWISEGDKEKICSILDCQKLTLEACTHAAQNDRLPLRTVVQVLFFEQLQLRHAITETISPAKTPQFCNRLDEGGKTDIGSPSMRTRDKAWENRVLRRSMDGMRTRMHELEHECSTMKKVIEKIDKVGVQDEVKCWSSKLGCKYNIQVCDSQQPTTTTAVVEYKKGRSRHHRHHFTP